MHRVVVQLCMLWLPLVQTNPGRAHWEAIKSILRYLKRTKGKGPLELKEFCDSNMAGDVDTHKYTSGFVYTLAGGAI